MGAQAAVESAWPSCMPKCRSAACTWPTSASALSRSHQLRARPCAARPTAASLARSASSASTRFASCGGWRARSRAWRSGSQGQNNQGGAAAHLSCSAACVPSRTARACGVNDGAPTSTPTPALRAAPCRRPAPPQPRPSAGLLPPRGRRPAPGWARLQGGAGGGGGVPHSRASWDAETMCQAAHMEPGHARQGQVDVRVPAQNPALWLCVVSSPL